MEEIVDALITICLTLYRKISKEKGPLDQLQTREFRTLIEGVKNKDPIFLLWLDLLYTTPLHFQEALSLIGEVPIPIKRVLDLSSGLGAYALAALHKGASEATRIDLEERRLDLSSEIFGKMGFPIKTMAAKTPLAIPNIREKYDLIVCSRTLFAHREDCPSRVTTLLSLASHLKEEGFILLVENSDDDTLKQFLQLRDELVAHNFPIQAPCVFRGECPARKANAPCYAQRPLYKPHLLKELQRGLDINLSSVKMAYLLLRNPKMGWPELPDRPLYRVISPPIDTMGAKRFYLCGTDGKKNLGSRLDVHPKKSRAFEYLKRGELISLKETLQNKSFVDIVGETEVTVEAPLGKPLPSLLDSYGTRGKEP